MAESTTLTDTRIQRAVDLIWREADLLDRKAYRSWNDLYAADGIYVIPVDTSIDDFENHLNMVYDDARMRTMRVQRLTDGYALSAVDSARTVRTVSRFVPLEVTETSISLRAGQVVIAYKRGTHELWAGNVEYTIRFGETATHDKIVRKVVRLVDAEDVVPASGFLL